MTSSTSSSRGFYISVASFVIIFLAAYEAFVRSPLCPKGQPSSLAFENESRIESFALEPHPDHEVVLIGSSLTANLQPEFRRGRITNLGMRGIGALTGAEVMHRLQSHPAQVIVENTSTLSYPPDEALLNRVLGFRLPMARPFAMFRRVNMPASLALSWTRPLPDEAFSESDPYMNRYRTERLAQVLEEQKKKQSYAEAHPLNPSLSGLLTRDFQELAAHGAKIDLVTVPGLETNRPSEYEVAMKVPISKAVRDLVVKNILQSKNVDDFHPVPTRDSVHMTMAAANNFYQHLLNGTIIDRPNH